jgi:hypothetical protein
METTIRRDYRGALRAETMIPLGVDRRELRITTSKGQRGLSCHASVVQVSEDGQCFSFAMFSDYSKRLACDHNARATEKTVRAMHAAALAEIPAVLAECIARTVFSVARALWSQARRFE